MRFELHAHGARTKLVLDHDALSDDQVPHIDSGWSRIYWDSLRKYLEA